nr:hypothetical protein [Tanacetum cinerariifolium]
MKNASNQDDGKVVDNVVSNHGKAVDNVVSYILQPEVKWIKNGAKAGIYGFGAIKSAYYSTSRQSREKSPSMPLKRAQKNEFNGALRFYWASL